MTEIIGRCVSLINTIWIALLGAIQTLLRLRSTDWSVFTGFAMTDFNSTRYRMPGFDKTLDNSTVQFYISPVQSNTHCS